MKKSHLSPLSADFSFNDKVLEQLEAAVVQKQVLYTFRINQ